MGELESIRKNIDKVDDEIMGLLIKRNALAKEIGRIKKNKNMQISDKKRETELINRLRKKAKENGLSEDFISALYGIILKNSKEEQEK